MVVINVLREGEPISDASHRLSFLTLVHERSQV